MAKKKQPDKKTINTISTIFSYVALVVLFTVAAFLIFYITSNIIAKATHRRPIISLFTIVSPSMEPYIMVYDVIVDTRVSNEDSLKVGDVITFYSASIDTGEFTVTHRIEEIIDSPEGKKYITKGDNNQNVDAGYITFKDIVGKEIFKISGLGRVQVFIASKFGWLIIILIPALVIILFDIFKLKKIYNIKREIEDIPQIKTVSRVRETEENKKLRSLTSKATRINKNNKR
jgi:signal peptidase